VSGITVTPGDSSGAKIEVEVLPTPTPTSHSDLTDLDANDHPQYEILILSDGDPVPDGYTGLYARLPA